MTPPPPPPPIKLLNRICIDLKNDPNGSEKNISVKKTGKSYDFYITIPFQLWIGVLAPFCSVHLSRSLFVAALHSLVSIERWKVLKNCLL